MTRALMVILSVISLGYFLPATVAVFRKKRNTGAIAVLNTFAGWTLIGWIGALVWASTNDYAN